MDIPQVSIIVPVFNKSKYLYQTLKSIKEQTFSDYEVIVVNDGSTDNSREIIMSFQKNDNRIKLFDIPNGGVSNARNFGLLQAKGEWIQFLDGDDIISDSYLECVIKEANQDKRIELVFSDFLMINSNNEVVKQITSQKAGVICAKEICTCFMELQEKNGFLGFISNKLFKRCLLQRFSLWFDNSIKLAEDLDFYSRLYSCVSYAYFSSCNSFLYLQTDDNYNNNPDIDYFAQLRVRVNIKRWFVNMNCDYRYQMQLNKTISKYVYLVAFHDNEKSDIFEEEYSFITDNIEIMNCLVPQAFEGFERKVLKAVSRKNYKKVKRLFKQRNFVRNIYRKVRH